MQLPTRILKQSLIFILIVIYKFSFTVFFLFFFFIISMPCFNLLSNIAFGNEFMTCAMIIFNFFFPCITNNLEVTSSLTCVLRILPSMVNFV